MNHEIHWVYIIECQNGTYYTGYTNNLIRRYHEHTSGLRCKYTRSFKPLQIAQCWPVLSGKSDALKLEHRIKKLSKAHKIKLIDNPEQVANMLS